MANNQSPSHWGKKLKENKHVQKAKFHLTRKEVIFAGIVLLIGALLGALGWFYHDRALPNLSVGGQSVSSLNRSEIEQVVKEQESQIKINFVLGDKQKTASANEIGLSVNEAATATKALDARRSGSIADRLKIWQKQEIPLEVTRDSKKLDEFINKNFPETTKPARDAILQYNEGASRFEITPGENGTELNLASFDKILPSLESDPRTVTYQVQTSPRPPKIQDADLSEAEAEINNRLGLPVNFKYGGGVIFAASRGDIASWINLAPDPDSPKMNISYDKEKIKQFLNQHVAPAIAASPVDKKIIRYPDGREAVTQEGQNGRRLMNIDALADEVYSAITQNQAFEKDVNVEEASFATVVLEGGDKWIEIDLSEQTLRMYEGEGVIATHLISSGTAATPTVTGEFAIWLKYPMQTMSGTSRTGEYYNVPDIPWVSYFFQDYALHGTYWHSNFGYPMSHGCVNMTIPAAKQLYDWAPIGTKVIVHY